jgi:hypothetical protein
MSRRLGVESASFRVEYGSKDADLGVFDRGDLRLQVSLAAYGPCGVFHVFALRWRSPLLVLTLFDCAPAGGNFLQENINLVPASNGFSGSLYWKAEKILRG